MALGRLLARGRDKYDVVGFRHGHVEQLARARGRYDAQRVQRPMVLTSVAEGRTPADGAVIGLRRGVRPLLDPAVLARIGEISDADLPPFIQERIRDSARTFDAT